MFRHKTARPETFGHAKTNAGNDPGLERGHTNKRMLQMKYASKIASLLVVAVLSVAGLTAVTSAYGDSGRGGHGAWSGGKGHHGKKMCGRHGGKHWKHGQKHLVEKLNIMETKIGIRANQLDAWRDFTDALLATMKRPGPGMMAAGDSPEPFSLAEGFADNMIARAESAEKLKAAIETLRTTLTPEQLDKVKAIEARLRAKFAKHHGPHGMGPHGMGPHGSPSEAQPDTGPSDTPDDGDDNDDDQP